MRKTTAMIAGIGAALGAGVMYLLDPDKGRRRRSLLSDKLNSTTQATADAVARTGRDASNRAKGMLHENKQRLAGEEVPDDVLVNRVRAEMGHVVSNASEVTVSALGGRVTLSGTAAADEVDALEKRVAKIPGVAGVENRLNPASVSEVKAEAKAEEGAAERPEVH